MLFNTHPTALPKQPDVPENLKLTTGRVQQILAGNGCQSCPCQRLPFLEPPVLYTGVHRMP